MSASLGFLSAIESLGAAYGVDTYSAGVERMQKALRALSETNWPSANPGRVDGMLDQQTAQAVANVIQHVPKIPDGIRTTLKYAIPLLIQFGWSSSQGVSARSFIKANAVSIAVPVEAYTVVRRFQGQTTQPPAASSSSSPSASAPLSTNAKIGLAVGIPIVLLILLKAVS